MKKLIITEEERSRILGMHQNATARQYLNEGLKEKLTNPDGIVKWTQQVVTQKKFPSFMVSDGHIFLVNKAPATPNEAMRGYIFGPVATFTSAAGLSNVYVPFYDYTTEGSGGGTFYLSPKDPMNQSVLGITIDNEPLTNSAAQKVDFAYIDNAVKNIPQDILNKAWASANPKRRQLVNLNQLKQINTPKKIQDMVAASATPSQPTTKKPTQPK